MSVWAPLFVTLNALATFRLTRLVTADELTLPLRRRVGGTDQIGDVLRVTRPRAWYFITCPWCTSVWIGAVVLALAWAWPAGWLWVAAALAFSTVAGMLGTWGGGE